MLQGLFATEHDGAQKLQTYWRNGSFAEKVLVPIENVHPIPESLLERYSPSQLLELTTICIPYGGLLAGNLEPGQRVMVQPATGHFGAGGVAIAIAMGASSVLAVGRNRTVLNELVKKFGPRVKPVIVEGNASDTSVYADVEPVDMVLNLYPPGSPVESTAYALSSLKSGGTLVLMGGIRDNVPLPYTELMLRCISVKGQFMYPSSAVKKVIGLIDAGLLDLSLFEQKTFKLEDVTEAVEFSASKENRGWLYTTVVEP
jgi:alcohol dehydrogenase